MTDLYSRLGGGPAPETRRAEGRPPPSPPSWTGPVQLPWSRRQPPPGLPLSPESPTWSSRTIPGPLPLSTTQPHFRLSRPLIAIAPGLGARGKGKKKKGGWRALASVSPSSPVAIRSAAAAPAPAVRASGSTGPDPFPSSPSVVGRLPAPRPLRLSRPAGPWPCPGRALRPAFTSGGRAGSLRSPPASRFPRGSAPAPGARCPPSSASGRSWSDGRAARAGEEAFSCGCGGHSCSHALPGSSL